nr:hypothetical protein [Lactococcus lactis]
MDDEKLIKSKERCPTTWRSVYPSMDGKKMLDVEGIKQAGSVGEV